MAISLFLGILICYKLGYYKNTLSIFKIKNILFLLFTTIVLFIIYFFTFTYYNSHFITPGIAKEQAAYSRQIVFPFVQFISFAWMHTGANPILIVYLPMSVVLTLIYHRRRVLGESILVHGLMNALLPTIIVLLQTITGLYYL
ncbi:CPBP family glutamic-type intramembrane protease [Lactococcus lactis]|uniref:CPBP family glutamic-type intramembrane protease n=1 Tax=Lactococcus lactis TaxID=1358 RepID=UPI002A9BDDD9|nr:hypothetical protein [Lactococcus lactis]